MHCQGGLLDIQLDHVQSNSGINIEIIPTWDEECKIYTDPGTGTGTNEGENRSTAAANNRLEFNIDKRVEMHRVREKDIVRMELTAQHTKKQTRKEASPNAMNINIRAYIPQIFDVNIRTVHSGANGDTNINTDPTNVPGHDHGPVSNNILLSGKIEGDIDIELLSSSATNTNNNLIQINQVTGTNINLKTTNSRNTDINITKSLTAHTANINVTNGNINAKRIAADTLHIHNANGLKVDTDTKPKPQTIQINALYGRDLNITTDGANALFETVHVDAAPVSTSTGDKQSNCFNVHTNGGNIAIDGMNGRLYANTQCTPLSEPGTEPSHSNLKDQRRENKRTQSHGSDGACSVTRPLNACGHINLHLEHTTCFPSTLITATPAHVDTDVGVRPQYIPGNVYLSMANTLFDTNKHTHFSSVYMNIIGNYILDNNQFAFDGKLNNNSAQGHLSLSDNYHHGNIGNTTHLTPHTSGKINYDSSSAAVYGGSLSSNAGEGSGSGSGSSSSHGKDSYDLFIDAAVFNAVSSPSAAKSKTAEIDDGKINMKVLSWMDKIRARNV